MRERITIRSQPQMKAYVNIPEGKGPFPAVLIFMHRPGVDKAMEKVADDLAAEGFIGICWDAYRNDTIRESYTDETIFEDFDATLEYVQNHMDNADSNRLGVIGFCMGGRHAYIAAARYTKKLKAVVSFYGFPTRGKGDYDTPIHLVDKMTIPVLGIFGKEDHLMDFNEVLKFKEKILVHKPEEGSHMVRIFDDVGHGFLDPYSKRYKDGRSAKEAWKETISSLKKYL